MDLILLLIFVSVSITFQEFSSGMKNGLFLRFFSLYIIFKVHRETSIYCTQSPNVLRFSLYTCSFIKTLAFSHACHFLV